MGGLWVLALLSLASFPHTEARSNLLKLFSIPPTTHRTPDATTAYSTPATVTTSEAVTWNPFATTSHVVEEVTVSTRTPSRETAIDQLVAFTDTTPSLTDMVVDILRAAGNETMSLDEFDVSDNSTTVTEPAATPRTSEKAATVPKGMIRMCKCTEVLECQLEARNETNNCFEHCDEQLAFLGNDTASYVDCFETNQDGVSHAESCLESTLGEYCTKSLTPQYIEARNYDEYANTKFIQNKEPKKTRPVLHRTHHMIAGFQEFYQCTKNCVHKRMLGCFRKKSCSVKLPSLASFGDTMNKCAKSNVKVARSLRSTCQCLLHKKNLKQLTGSCAQMIPFRVKNV